MYLHTSYQRYFHYRWTDLSGDRNVQLRFPSCGKCRSVRIPCRWCRTDQGYEEDRSTYPYRACPVQRAGFLRTVRIRLDADTKEKLAQGERIKEVLKQPQYQPMPVQYQVIIIYAVTKRFLLDVPVEEITRFEKEFFEYLDTKHPEIPAAIAEEKVISDATEEKLVKALE